LLCIVAQEHRLPCGDPAGLRLSRDSRFFFDSRYASEVRKEYLLYLYPGSVRPGERVDVPGEPMVSGVEKACKKEKKKKEKKCLDIYSSTLPVRVGGKRVYGRG